MLNIQVPFVPAAAAVPASRQEADRHAYNAAFGELELSWRWDARTYRELLGIAAEKDRIRTYIQRHQAHLLRAYDVGFLCDLIYERQRYWLEVLGSRPPDT
jgi:hypothetical protein